MNQKVKISLLLILLVAFALVMSTGVTWTYFADSEVSSGNSFQAADSF
jgi:predicted ribosomally synthesized peptide with SipW-like signal peptide